jgi:hypothetical protein
MVSEDGIKWMSIEKAYGLHYDKNFEIEFYADGKKLNAYSSQCSVRIAK